MVTPRAHPRNKIHFIPTLILCLICFRLGCLFQRMNQVTKVLTNQSLLEDAIQFRSFESNPSSKSKHYFQISKQVKSNSNKNLVVINSLGRKENLKLALYNKVTHFPSETWSCVAFVHADDILLPESNKNLRKLQDPERGGCTIVRVPGTEWGHFLQFLPPDFISPSYDHIALLLDDMFLPKEGPSPVHIPTLLQSMKEYNLMSISPGIRGDHHGWMDPLEKRQYQKCLVNAKAIEMYLQIFTAEGWECFYHTLHYSGGKGWCYDTCFKPVCGGTLAIDYRMIAYHTELRSIRSSIPKKALQSTGLHFHGESKDKKGYTPEEVYQHSVICRKWNCVKPTPEEVVIGSFECDYKM